MHRKPLITRHGAPEQKAVDSVRAHIMRLSKSRNVSYSVALHALNEVWQKDPAKKEIGKLVLAQLVKEHDDGQMTRGE